MYMPNLIPRDVHHLWLKNDDNKKQDSRTTGHQNNSDEDSSFSSSVTNYAPPLSSYSSERPGATNFDLKAGETDIIQNEIQIKLRQLRSVRTLGYSYLAPLGIGKTMETIDDEIEMKRQMEEQFQAEAPTAENLLGEADNQVEQHATPQFVQDRVRSPHVNPQQTPSSAVPETETQLTEQIDLDDEIPEADENSYSIVYDENESEVEADGNTFERQYDQGFMVAEQFESQEPLDPIVTPQPQQRQQFSSSGRPESILHQRHEQFLRSGGTTSLNSSFYTESSYNEDGNVSIDGSDLDMTLDD